MNTPRTLTVLSLLRRAAITVAIAIAPMGTFAQAYPNKPIKPIKMMIGYTAGGAADGVFRALQHELEQELGQPLIVEYRPGAGGTIAAEQLSRATPDGYTLALLGSGPVTLAPALKKQKYDPLSGFTQIAMFAAGAGAAVVVPSSSPLKTMADLVAAAKRAPGQLTYGTSGVGGAAHLAAELFQSVTGTSLVHVPYKGGAQLMTDLMGGQTPLAFAALTTVIGQEKSGKIRILGVVSPERSGALPDIPTVKEQGIPAVASAWWSLAGPANLPASVTSKLDMAIRKVLQNPTVIENLKRTGYDAQYQSAARLREMTIAELEKWTRLVKDARIVVE